MRSPRGRPPFAPMSAARPTTIPGRSPRKHGRFSSARPPQSSADAPGPRLARLLLMDVPTAKRVTGAAAPALVILMMTRTIHSPAGANPLVVFSEHADWSFLISPLLLGMAVLFITAWLVNNRRGAGPYPRTWR